MYMWHTEDSIVNLCAVVTVSSDHLSKQLNVNLAGWMSKYSLRRWELCVLKAMRELLWCYCLWVWGFLFVCLFCVCLLLVFLVHVFSFLFGCFGMNRSFSYVTVRVHWTFWTKPPESSIKCFKKISFKW